MKRVHVGAVPQPDNQQEISKLSLDDFMLYAGPLVQLMAEVMDTAVSEGDAWISMGTTRKSDALVMTVHTRDGSLSIYGKSLVALLSEVPSLL